MAHLFVDDGSHEADEYASNFIYFDENDPASLQEALKMARGQNKQNTASERLTSDTKSFPAFASSRTIKGIF